jgi:hypothetical protein
MTTVNELELAYKKIAKERNLDESHIFSFGITEVFSWRGIYAQPAFRIEENVSLKQINDVLDNAYADHFEGYKGGEFSYDEDSVVNFEMDYGAYTDGGYANTVIAKIKARRGLKHNNVSNSYDYKRLLIELLIKS